MCLHLALWNRFLEISQSSKLTHELRLKLFSLPHFIFHSHCLCFIIVWVLSRRILTLFYNPSQPCTVRIATTYYFYKAEVGLTWKWIRCRHSKLWPSIDNLAIVYLLLTWPPLDWRSLCYQTKLLQSGGGRASNK